MSFWRQALDRGPQRELKKVCSAEVQGWHLISGSGNSKRSGDRGAPSPPSIQIFTSLSPESYFYLLAYIPENTAMLDGIVDKGGLKE